ncbi:MAG: hypothetical protein PVJ84_00690 [Desulfobacteraceae bacterium]
MVILRSIVVVMVLAAFLSMGVGCSSKESPNQLTGMTKESQPAAESKGDQPVTTAQEKLPGVAPKEVADKAPAAAESKTLALTGTVEQEGDNMVLSTDLGDYIIAGEDLSGLVGKTVNVTGAVEEANGKYTINVLSFFEE